MKQHRRHAAPHGFTLIELMVALALAAILMTIAAPSFLAFQRNSELTSATNGLVAAIAAARGEAMKRGMSAMVLPADGATWKSGWVVFIDNGDRVFSEPDDKVVAKQSALPSHLTVSATGTANEAEPYLMFDGSGYPKLKGGGFAQLKLSIAREDVPESVRWEQTRRIIISLAGRIRSCRPTSASDANCSAPDNDN
jgi:type IV fimbrial biogenesis protein FimT